MKGKQQKDNSQYQQLENYNSIPITEIDLSIPLQVSGSTKRSDKYLELNKKATRKDKSIKKDKARMKKHRKKKIVSSDEHNSDEDYENADSTPSHLVNTTIEMPEGATLTDNEDQQVDVNDPHRALDIDLDM